MFNGIKSNLCFEQKKKEMKNEIKIENEKSEGVEDEGTGVLTFVPSDYCEQTDIKIDTVSLLSRRQLLKRMMS